MQVEEIFGLHRFCFLKKEVSVMLEQSAHRQENDISDRQNYYVELKEYFYENNRQKRSGRIQRRN